MRGLLAVVGAVTLLGLGGTANSAPIEYDLTVTGSGTLNGVDFTNQTGVISLFGDTSNVTTTNLGGRVYSNSVLGTFALNGVTGVIGPTLSLMDVQGINFGSLALRQSGNLTIFQSNPGFITYALQTSAQIGPAGNGGYGQVRALDTSLGALKFDTVSSESFSATVSTVLGTPGPIAGAGLVPLLGLAGAYLFGRKRLAA